MLLIITPFILNTFAVGLVLTSQLDFYIKLTFVFLLIFAFFLNIVNIQFIENDKLKLLTIIICSLLYIGGIVLAIMNNFWQVIPVIIFSLILLVIWHVQIIDFRKGGDL